MNKTIKAKWLRALRRGKYKQGRGALRSLHNEYCCLGVLAECVGGKAIWQRKADGYFIKPTRHDKVLPDKFLAKAGLSIDKQEEAACRNDGIGWRPQSFKQIANWIKGMP